MFPENSTPRPAPGCSAAPGNDPPVVVRLTILLFHPRPRPSNIWLLDVDPLDFGDGPLDVASGVR